MAKILKVIKPFFVMEKGDTFELSADGKEYISTFNMERYEGDDRNSSVSSKYTSNYTISFDFAKSLINEGYVEEVEEAKKDNFINVFDEINTLLDTYHNELNCIDADMAEMPACLKIEKETVLNNLITVLDHLSSLRK